MRVKALVAFFAFITSSVAMAYCANTYEVARDADDVRRYARDFAQDSRWEGYRNIARRARQLARSARQLESSARSSFTSCASVIYDFNQVSLDFSDLRRAYVNSGRDRDLSYDFKRLRRAYRSLSSSIRFVRNTRRHRPMPRPLPPRRHRPLPPRRHRPAPRPAPPRHRPAPRPAPPRHRPDRPHRPGRDHGRGRGHGRGHGRAH